MEYTLSYIPLIVLLIILVTGCGYYLYLYKLTISQVFGFLKGHEVPSSLEDKSIAELEELLSLNQALEYFERCAQIRDEINKRLGYRV